MIHAGRESGSGVHHSSRGCGACIKVHTTQVLQLLQQPVLKFQTGLCKNKFFIQNQLFQQCRVDSRRFGGDLALEKHQVLPPVAH